MAIALADVSVVINNEPIAIVPNSVTYTEGLGEQNMRVASAGGGSVEQVFSNDIETNLSMVNFEVFNDIETIELVRSWKVNRNNNTVSLSGRTPDGLTMTRTFRQQSLMTTRLIWEAIQLSLLNLNLAQRFNL